MGAKAPLNFEKGVIAFINFHVNRAQNLEGSLYPSIEIPNDYMIRIFH